MPFEFFGSRQKSVIGMVHIGALPAMPLYDVLNLSRATLCSPLIGSSHGPG
jgi:predicted TIM-barrel enzyme